MNNSKYKEQFELIKRTIRTLAKKRSHATVEANKEYGIKTTKVFVT
jgi:hypothetical protein